MIRWIFLAFAFSIAGAALGYCQEGSAPAPETAATAAAPEVNAPKDAAPESHPQVQTNSVKKTRGNRAREKEAEGSQAPNRFEADIVIKSKYQRNGEPLEVDPD